MARWYSIIFPLLGLAVIGGIISCSESSGPSFTAPLTSTSSGQGAVPRKSPASLKREVNLQKSILKKGRYARRKIRRLNPRFITIHSTQNFSKGADAWRHAKALHGGKLRGGRIGYMGWHYTVDQNVAVQHLPLNEQGDHADLHGPGNKYSIGIEMCEHKGNNISRTIDRTAKLTAVLMYENQIPLRNVVPHYHWPRKGYSKPNKNCPHFLLDNGRPGKKWRWFQSRVNSYYRQITAPAPSQSQPSNARYAYN